jgi:hypothetical protein
MYDLIRSKIFLLIIFSWIDLLIKTYVFPVDVFLPTPDSLLVNLFESKEVRLIYFLKIPKCFCNFICLLVINTCLLDIAIESSDYRPQRCSDTRNILECVKEEYYLVCSVTQLSILFSQLIKDLLDALPNMFTSTRETHSALGPALQAAFKLMSPTGGRVSVFQTQLPSLGAGLLQSREDPNQRSSTKVLYVYFLCHVQWYFYHWLFVHYHFLLLFQ